MTTASLNDTRLRVLPIRGGGALADLRAEWETLDLGVVFCSWQWLESWWRHYEQPDRELWTVAIRNAAGELVGLAPWYLSHAAGEGRVVRFLGTGEVCSDYLTVLARPRLEHQVARALGDWLADEAADEWDLVELTGVEGNNQTVNHFRDHLRTRGHVVHEQPDVNCWRLSLPGGWDPYLAELSTSRRQRTRMLLRRSFDSGRAVLRKVETPQQLDRAFEILVELHQKRRESLSQAGCFASQRFTNFHREVTARLLESGRLRLLWVELEGRPIAVEYGFVGGDTIYYYQGGFEPELADERPGWLGFAGSLRLAIEQGYRSFDFLRGDESYKTSWSAEPRELRQMRVVARRPAARVRHAAWRTGETVKRWAKQGLNRAEVWKAEALRAVSAAGTRKGEADQEKTGAGPETQKADPGRSETGRETTEIN